MTGRKYSLSLKQKLSFYKSTISERMQLQCFSEKEEVKAEIQDIVWHFVQITLFTCLPSYEGKLFRHHAVALTDVDWNSLTGTVHRLYILVGRKWRYFPWWSSSLRLLGSEIFMQSAFDIPYVSFGWHLTTTKTNAVHRDLQSDSNFNLNKILIILNFWHILRIYLI